MRAVPTAFWFIALPTFWFMAAHRFLVYAVGQGLVYKITRAPGGFWFCFIELPVIWFSRMSLSLEHLSWQTLCFLS